MSYLGPALAAVLTGSLMVEQIFGLPGIGRYFVQGALNRDYTLVMGVVICYAALIIVLNFLADIALRHARSARAARHDRHRSNPQMPTGRAVKGRSLWEDARRRLFRNRAAMASMVILALIAAAGGAGAAAVALRL